MAAGGFVRNRMPAVVLACCLLFLLQPAWGGRNFFHKFIEDLQTSYHQNVLKREYDKLETILISSVPTDEINANMEEIRRWADYYANEIKGKKVSKTLEALTQLEALSDVDPEPCTLSSHSTLMANDRATGGFLARLKPGEKPSRRIDKIVYHYALKEARECEFYYMSEFELGGLHLDPNNYERLVEFVGELIGSRVDRNLIRHLKLTNSSSFLDERPLEADRFAKSLNFKNKDLTDGRIAHKWISNFATKANDSLVLFVNKIQVTSGLRQKVRVFHEKLNELFEKYLVAPCDEYVEQMNNAFSNNLALVKINVNIDKDDLIKAFYRHSTYWHGCKQFLLKKNVVFNNLIRWVNKNGRTVSVAPTD